MLIQIYGKNSGIKAGFETFLWVLCQWTIKVLSSENRNIKISRFNMKSFICTNFFFVGYQTWTLMFYCVCGVMSGGVYWTSEVCIYYCWKIHNIQKYLKTSLYVAILYPLLLWLIILSKTLFNIYTLDVK